MTTSRIVDCLRFEENCSECIAIVWPHIVTTPSNSEYISIQSICDNQKIFVQHQLENQIMK